MKKTRPGLVKSRFEDDVRKGLTAFPKFLSSKYIYDQKGDELFQKIMAMPSYYLTPCEFEILEKHQTAIADYFAAKEGFDFIELGAGDGKKTKILLRCLIEHGIQFEYLPIDISSHILKSLEQSLKIELPNLHVTPLQGTYFAILKKLASYTQRKKVIVVLGSNIGNLYHEEAVNFLQNIKEAMQPGDMLFMGFDQKKNPQTILNAYNDETGITEAFNKNLLLRINREMAADFDPDQFKHWESYNPETGTAKSFLVSRREQQVTIGKLDLKIYFKAWESIHTEISQKYNDASVTWLAGQAGLEIVESFTDDKGYYKNYVFQIDGNR